MWQEGNEFLDRELNWFETHLNPHSKHHRNEVKLRLNFSMNLYDSLDSNFKSLEILP